MDIIDYLLLDYICDVPCSFVQLNSPDADQLFNKRHHNLSNNGLAYRLKVLYEKGYISIFLENCLESSSVDELLSHDDCLIKLTQNGGKSWESNYKPNWNLFISEEILLLENDLIEVSICAPLRETLEDFIHPFTKIQPINITSKESWEANYWKKFNLGFVCNFIMDEKTYDKILPMKPVWRLT